MVDGQQIARKALSVDLSVAGRRRHRHFAELFPLHDIGNMDLHLRHLNTCQCVPDGFLTLVNRIIWQKPHNCGFFYVKFIKF